jgi:hypothetical protein
MRRRTFPVCVRSVLKPRQCKIRGQSSSCPGQVRVQARAMQNSGGIAFVLCGTRRQTFSCPGQVRVAAAGFLILSASGLRCGAIHPAQTRGGFLILSASGLRCSAETGLNNHDFFPRRTQCAFRGAGSAARKVPVCVTRSCLRPVCVMRFCPCPVCITRFCKGQVEVAGARRPDASFDADCTISNSVPIVSQSAHSVRHRAE